MGSLNLPLLFAGGQTTRTITVPFWSMFGMRMKSLKHRGFFLSLEQSIFANE